MRPNATLEGMLYGQDVDISRDAVINGNPALQPFADFFLP